MIKIRFVTVGKLKEKYFKDAVYEYAKRLSRYCDLSFVELNPEFLPEQPSNAEIKAALEREAQAISKSLIKNGYNIVFCIEGKQKSSGAFAETVKECENSGKPINFIIGSSYGLSDTVKSAADLKLSFSQMTFPHKLFKVMALEQLYRAFKINEGSAYHK